MPEAHPNLAELLERVRGGSEDAARTLVEEYGSHILRVVRRRMQRSLRPRFDSDDFVQAVWASFFARRDDFAGLEGREGLVALLGRLASNKVIEELRRRIKMERARLGERRPDDPPADVPNVDLPGRVPTPSQVAIAKETWNQLAGGRSGIYQQILDLRRRGLSNLEMAQTLGVSEKTIRRLFRRLAAEFGHE